MRHTTWIFAALLLVACGENSDDAVEPAPPEAVEPEEAIVPEEVVDTETASTGYTIHEWGLIDVDLTAEAVEYAAGPGRAPAGSGSGSSASGGSGSASSGSTGSGTTGSGSNTDREPDVVDNAVDTANQVLDVFTGGPPAGRRKPVLYFHLADGAEALTFDLTVNLHGGNIVEHFPAGDLADHQVTWSQVSLSADSCTGGPYPRAEDPICTNVSDHYCEAAELADYVAADAGCLSVRGQQQNFLFYRGDGAAPTIPLTIERADDGAITVTNDAIDEAVGPLLRLRRGQGGAIQVAQAAIPSRGQSVTVAAPTEAAGDTHRDIVRTQLTALGLTQAEARAFEQAWFGELFDGEAETPHALPDAVLFFLPAAAVDAFAHLEATPAPSATMRAMAVRAGWPTVD